MSHANPNSSLTVTYKPFLLFKQIVLGMRERESRGGKRRESIPAVYRKIICRQNTLSIVFCLQKL